MVVVYTSDGIDADGVAYTHLLIPRTTFLRQIAAAESRRTDDGEPMSAVPWEDWGPSGCLQLRLGCQQWSFLMCAVPFGSRFPLAVLDGPDFRSGSVYIFDINPYVARHQRQTLQATRQRHDSESSKAEESGTTSLGQGMLVEDVEAVLPGVVDPDCSSIPYVVYCFKLPYASWEQWHMIQSVVMSMTGFTVKVSIQCRYLQCEVEN